MSDILFIDVETRECTDPDVIDEMRAMIKPPGNIKLEKSKQKWMDENSDQALAELVKKTSFDGWSGGILCISWAVNNQQVQSVSVKSQSEEDMLAEFFNKLVDAHGANFSPVWCGHNISDFDLPFIFKRCVVNKVRPLVTLPHNSKPWSHDVTDTLYEANGNNKAGGSLNKIAKALGIGSKTEGIDGSKVNQYYLDGRISEIVSYCEQDTELVRRLHKRLTFKE